MWSPCENDDNKGQCAKILMQKLRSDMDGKDGSSGRMKSS